MTWTAGWHRLANCVNVSVVTSLSIPVRGGGVEGGLEGGSQSDMSKYTAARAASCCRWIDRALPAMRATALRASAVSAEGMGVAPGEVLEPLAPLRPLATSCVLDTVVIESRRGDVGELHCTG